jgi:hypothetical protein
MRYIKSILILFVVSTILFSCTKYSTSPTNKLPPYTTQGLNTFGCLVDGNIFVPQGPIGEIILGSAYQYLYFDTTQTKNSVFNIGAIDKPQSFSLSTIHINLDSIKLHQGDTFELGARIGSNYFGSYSYTAPNSTTYYTTNGVKGQIIISYLDEINQIVSGTFWFNALSSTGDTVYITEGRFDTKYIK